MNTACSVIKKPSQNKTYEVVITVLTFLGKNYVPTPFIWQ